MIELVSDARCVGCDICVKVCPTNVFEAVPGQAPVIARQEDCQTCFMCELYCPTDALFVAPDADGTEQVSESELVQRGALGSYRAAIGWGKGQKPGARLDQSFKLLYVAPASMGAALPGAEPSSASPLSPAPNAR
jgi:NAD-dependent dihydropyrimidine dehydrogenase PreA subunit